VEEGPPAYAHPEEEVLLIGCMHRQEQRQVKRQEERQPANARRSFSSIEKLCAYAGGQEEGLPSYACIEEEVLLYSIRGRPTPTTLV
jgi:hypothetical protein